MLPQSAFRAQLYAPICLYSNGTRRLFSATSAAFKVQEPSDSVSTPINPRWLTATKRRVGKCLMFGMKPAQIDEGGRILQQLAKEWRELIAGGEGFLTDKKRRSLYRHHVVWGEQDTMNEANPDNRATSTMLPMFDTPKQLE
ncbi:thioesterase-like superfamily-domain-containing protein [Penicillium digitatum]|uniref:Thioesterase-like superfamily-domain-containing protein n=1 Tax=Penicillium digitatum TaxID=36651 RepID=A0A7T6XRY5_PENDI|nr:thioesterase-like superfamily-domain-containing protein [Penicillium digitatum]